MTIRVALAKAAGHASTWGLRTLFRREAGNMPGKIALRIDPQFIAHLRSRVRHSVVVVGTNGKTTSTNMIADVLQAHGASVVCNRSGANLAYGVASALLHAPKTSDWGVIESDELWLARTLPQLQADYVVLLNLFRDQLDRCGEIDRVQDAIACALKESPHTTLLFNADDPQCAVVAEKVANRSIGFGLGEDLGLSQNTVADAQMCQKCEGMLVYEYRQYGQLGAYECSRCGFRRPNPQFVAQDVRLGAEQSAFTLNAPDARWRLDLPFGGAYMVYNVAAVASFAMLAGCRLQTVQQAISAFAPHNGRLQAMQVGQSRVLLNLAKNPTGFNQNLKLVVSGAGPRTVAFFINDKEADGHDISWLWDIDFEELAAIGDMRVFAGGIRANDMQLRLKYAGIAAEVVGDVRELFDRVSGTPMEQQVFCIANYTALPAVKEQLEDMATAAGSSDSLKAAEDVGAATEHEAKGTSGAEAAARNGSPSPRKSVDAIGNDSKAAKLETPITILHLYPDLLNLYGDGGNVLVLRRRLEWRGIPVEVRAVHTGDATDFEIADLVILGGSPDREQRLAARELVEAVDEMRAYVEADGPLLAICGGYQMLGTTWILDGEEVPGLGVLDMHTERAPGGSTNRLIGNIVLDSPLSTDPVVGFENHAGRTVLHEGTDAFGQVISSVGHGNDDASGRDGARYRNVVGTYLHGPLLGKNPQVADYLLEKALERHAKRTGEVQTNLTSLDDNVEKAANRVMVERLHAGA